MQPRCLTLLLVAACAALANAQAPGDCNAINTACCPGNATDAPADLPIDEGGNKIKWCRGDGLICLPGKTWQDPYSCQAYPLASCGATGQACCTGSYHNPTPPDKPLGPQCVGANDYCSGGTCKTNDPDCGTLDKQCCGGKSEVVSECTCQDGLGLLTLQAKICTPCPNGRANEYQPYCK